MVAKKLQQKCRPQTPNERNEVGFEAERVKILRGIAHDNSDGGKQPGEADSSLATMVPPPIRAKISICTDFSGAFRKAGQLVLAKGGLKAGVAPTLDQAGRRWYEKKKSTEYTDLKPFFF